MDYPEFLYNKQVKVYITKLGEDGEEENLLYDGPCTYNEESRQVLNADKQLVTLSGSIIIGKDIYPNKIIEGYVRLDGINRKIFKTTRPRKPDGFVFSTELELI